MNTTIHNTGGILIAEIAPEGFLISNTQDGVDLLGNMYFENIDKVIIHKASLTPDFFDLKNGIAGDILQKFSNYRVRLAIVGDFLEFKSKSLIDFMYECNKRKQIVFVGTLEEGMKVLSE